MEKSKKIGVFFVFLILISCQGMNDNIEEYLKRGEVNYLARVDSAKVFGGKERIMFDWKVALDPRIEACAIYWNNKQDSAICSIDRQMVDDNRFSFILSDI